MKITGRITAASVAAVIGLGALTVTSAGAVTASWPVQYRAASVRHHRHCPPGTDPGHGGCVGN